MNTDNETTWLYYKICIGARMDGMDFLIRGVVAQTALDPRVLQWFYIRYFDQDGPHLRVRLKVRTVDAKLADREFHTRFHDGTTALTTLLPSESRPLITVPNASTAIPRGTFPARARRATYEPEHDIYGGPAGVVIAESVFQVSSEIALAVLGDGSGDGHERKDLAPAMMLVALDEFIAKDAQPAFLETYVNHWLAASPGLGYLKTLFHERALELLDDGEPILVAEAKLPEGSQRALQQWRRALGDAHARYRKSKELHTPALVERVCFYFLHLMNNRLGFTALEEAYLSVLLLNTRRARSDVQEPA